LEENLKKA